jgi:hypothetical protein
MRNKDQILLESLYSEMAYPVSFSFEEFNNIKSYRGKMKYAQERLQRLSSGSSRIVYKVDDEKVLKLAKNEKGIAQNATESDWSIQRSYSIVAKIFEKDDDNYWVEMEFAKKISPKRFKELSGISLEEINKVLTHLKDANNPRGYQDRNKVLENERSANQIVENNEFLSELWDMIMNYDMSYPADFTRISSYGEVLRDGVPKAVLIDFGLTRSTWEDFYKVN